MPILQALTVQHHHIPTVLRWELVWVSITMSPTSFHQLYRWSRTRLEELTLEAQ